ncbi:polyamine aminopropyltransferase [Planctomycetota bacterium]|nr:polyamine aminopropyltransferase [Planctomycetota bacterium]
MSETDPPTSSTDPAVDSPAADHEPASQLGATALYLTTLLIATCGLVYELVAATVASYLLGDSVTQFSLVIGTYLSAMGLGSYISKYVPGNLLPRFIAVEIAVGVIGGCSAALLFGSYAYLGMVRPVLFGLVGIVGTLVGLEIPLLMRVLKDEVAFGDLVARVLAFDYMGALAASLLFPLLLVPLLGLTRTAFVFGMVNTVVAFALTYVFARQLGTHTLRLRISAAGTSLFLLAGAVGAEQVALLAEEDIYGGKILIKEKSPYQAIVITRWRDDVRLFLNGHLQFSSKDEHRYHESLVHPGAASVGSGLKTALILGGGDGMALRELLRYPSLEQATLVDLDPRVTELFTQDDMLRGLNGNAYHDPRATVVNRDAMKWLEEHDEVFDLIVVDLPDPSNTSVGKLFTREMYRLIHRHLAVSGAMVVQSTNPRVAPRSYWCIVRTIEDAGFTTHPFHVHVPSFGEWGFVLATPTARPAPTRLAVQLDELRFLNDGTLQSLFAQPLDLGPPPDIEINRLNEQRLVGYYASEWSKAD